MNEEKEFDLAGDLAEMFEDQDGPRSVAFDIERGWHWLRPSGERRYMTEEEYSDMTYLMDLVEW